jgi:hypothetical protein
VEQLATSNGDFQDRLRRRSEECDRLDTILTPVTVPKLTIDIFID